MKPVVSPKFYFFLFSFQWGYCSCINLINNPFIFRQSWMRILLSSGNYWYFYFNHIYTVDAKIKWNGSPKSILDNLNAKKSFLCFFFQNEPNVLVEFHLSKVNNFFRNFKRNLDFLHFSFSSSNKFFKLKLGFG